MQIIKIGNFIKNQQADYKGLVRKQIVAGTQLYPNDENVAYFFYNGEVQASEDVEVIDQSTYDQVRETMKNNLPPDPIKELQTKQELMQKAIDDLILGGAL